MLFIIPTPVGNLQDMTFRAIETLKSVDLILAEDTRTSSILLQHFDIHTPLKSHHKFNEHETSADIVERLKAGANIALISDAGTPAISDPGFFLVRAAAEANIEIQCLPGATAFVPALVDSGLPNNHFYFCHRRKVGRQGCSTWQVWIRRSLCTSRLSDSSRRWSNWHKCAAKNAKRRCRARSPRNSKIRNAEHSQN